MHNHTDEVYEIQLNHGQITIVDIEDSDLGLVKWLAKLAHNRYYARRTGWKYGKKTSESLHRIIMERILGRPLDSREIVDHQDNNPLNNRRSNLRLATYTQNNCNAKARKNKRTSPFKGVDWSSSGENWRARITINAKTIHLGVFASPEEAHAAYCKAAKEIHGEFARYE